MSKTTREERRQGMLVRRAAIRRLLANRYSATNGFTSHEQIREALAEMGHEVTELTVRKDMKALGATKVRIDGEPRSFWFIPPWNPELAPVKPHIDQGVVEQEVAARLNAYVRDLFAWKDEVIILTEQNCGRMVADWVALLEWPGVVHVREHAHSVSILCEGEEQAEQVVGRLLGEA